MIPSIHIRSTTTSQAAPVEKIAVSISILDKLAGHIIRHKGTGLHQIQDISHAKMLVYPHLVSGACVVSTRGSSQEVGDALTVIGKRLACPWARTPKKKSTSASTATPPTTTGGVKYFALGYQPGCYYPPQF